MSKSGFTGSNTCDERVTIRIPEEKLEEINARVEAGEYPNQSEAIRQLIDDGLRQGGEDDV